MLSLVTLDGNCSPGEGSLSVLNKKHSTNWVVMAMATGPMIETWQLRLKQIFSFCISNLQSISMISFVYYSCLSADWTRKLLGAKVGSLCDQVESSSETIPQPPCIIRVIKSFSVFTKCKKSWKDPPICR